MDLFEPLDLARLVVKRDRSWRLIRQLVVGYLVDHTGSDPVGWRIVAVTLAVRVFGRATMIPDSAIEVTISTEV
jgi:hypothetical protein